MSQTTLDFTLARIDELAALTSEDLYAYVDPVDPRAAVKAREMVTELATAGSPLPSVWLGEDGALWIEWNDPTCSDTEILADGTALCGRMC